MSRVDVAETSASHVKSRCYRDTAICFFAYLLKSNGWIISGGSEKLNISYLHVVDGSKTLREENKNKKERKTHNKLK